MRLRWLSHSGRFRVLGGTTGMADWHLAHPCPASCGVSRVVTGALLSLVCLLAARCPAHSESGTWPPIGQLAGGIPLAVAVQGSYAYVASTSALLVVDTSEPETPSIVGSYDTPGMAYGVAVSGAYAYVADYDAGVRVVDVSDPAAPVEVGYWDTPGLACAVAVSDGYAYVADSEAGVRVIDVSNPSAPVEVGYWDTTGSARGVAVSGSHAYVADSDDGLRVIDVLNPGAPIEVGYWDTTGGACGVAVSAGLAYVADSEAGLRLIDISDPAAPVEMGYWDTTRVACGVAVSAGYAYVADLSEGLVVVRVSETSEVVEEGLWEPLGWKTYMDVAVSGQYAFVAAGDLFVIDVSDPAHPAQVGSCLTPGDARSVEVSDDYAFVGDKGGGLRVIDVSDPASPVEVGAWNIETYGGVVNGVAVAGTYAYATGTTITTMPSGGLWVIDVSDPSAPLEVGQCITGGAESTTWGVELSGQYAYVAATLDGLLVIDVQDPAHPAVLGSCDTPGTAFDVSVAGGYAYVAASSAGVRVVDTSDPSSPSEIAHWDTPGYAGRVLVADGKAFVSAGALQVVDVSNPASPSFMWQWGTDEDVDGVAVSGQYVYAGERDDGHSPYYSALHIISFREAGAVTGVGTCATFGSARSVAATSGYVCVAADPGGMWMVDVSEPRAPTLAGSCGFEGNAWGVAMADGYAYVAAAGSGLRVVDTLDPAAPMEVGHWTGPGIAWSVAAATGHAYVADSSAGLRVIDVSDPAAPVQLGYLGTPGMACDVAVSGSYAYVADGEAGVRVIDVSDPADLVEVGYCDTAGEAEGVALGNGYAYVGEGHAGLAILALSDPSHPVEVGSVMFPGYAGHLAVAGDYAYVAARSAGLHVVDVSDPTQPREVAWWDTPGSSMGVAVSGGYVYLADSQWGLLVFPEFSGAGDCDLSVGLLEATPPSGAASQELTSLAVTVSNSGSGAAGVCELDVYTDRSAEPTGNQRGDVRLAIPELGPGDSTTVTAQLAVGGGPRQAWARLDVADVVSETDETNNTYGPVAYEVPGIPTVATAFWDFALTGLVGGDVNALALEFMDYGFSGIEVGAAAEATKGLRLELERRNDQDQIVVTRSGAVGARFTGEALSIDPPLLRSMDLAAWEAGLKYTDSRKCLFTDPFDDDDQAMVVSAFVLGDLAELAAVAAAPVAPDLSLAVIGLTEAVLGHYEREDPTYQDGTRHQIDGRVEGSVARAEVGMKVGPVVLSFGGSVPAPVAGAVGMGTSIYAESWLHPDPDPVVGSTRVGEVGFELAPRVQINSPFINLPGGSVTLGAGQVFWDTDPPGGDPATGYFLTWESQLENHAEVFGFSSDVCRSSRTRVDAPDATVAEVWDLLLDTPWYAMDSLVQLSPEPFAAGLCSTVDELLAYSAARGDTPIAWWETTDRLGYAGEAGFNLSIGGALVFGADLNLGLSGTAAMGREYTSAAGEFVHGELVPVTLYSPLPATYEFDEGLKAMLLNLLARGILRAATYVSAWFDVATGVVEQGTQDVIQAVQDGAEGVTQIVVDGAALGQTVTGEIASYSADLGQVLFPGTAPAARRGVPYRARGLTRAGSAVQSKDLVLTLVGRVHVVGVSDGLGEPLSVFPAGAVTFETTVVPGQLIRAGFTEADIASVRLYRYRPEDISWEEVFPTSTPHPDGSVTLSAALALPGEYAPGVVGAVGPETGPVLVNSWPADREMCASSPVSIGLVVRGTEGVDPRSVALRVDGVDIAPDHTDVSTYGTYLLTSATVTLSPGSHTFTVAASDPAGNSVTRRTLFYVERLNTFPDVPHDHWAWSQVEATKMAGVVSGYDDGLYHPELPVGRDQMAVYISRALAGGDDSVPDGPATPSFSDVLSTHWAYKHIEYAVSQGVVQGYEDGAYHPEYEVTRDQMAVYVARSMVAPSGEAGLADYTPADPRNFPDALSTFWAYRHIEYCVSQAVVAGYGDGLYHPEYPVTRDQMAVYVARAFHLPM